MNTLISNEDVDYLAKQGDISLILSGMMALLQDSDNKVEEIQKQNWFQRMWKTVTGKNKATAKEVQQNHEKLSVYMTQAMRILFERNVMTQQMVNNLGLQLNVLYQEHNHLKEMLGGFVEKLNEKIVSIDNFHMLSEEIRLKMYANDKPVIAICKVVTQLDERTVNDPRKMQILQQSLLQEGVLSETPVSLQELFMDLLTCTSEEAGQFILGLGAIRQHYLPSLFLEFLETYYYMSDMERKLKSKEKFCTHYMDMKQIENDISLTSFELYQNNVEALQESFVRLDKIADDNRNYEQMENSSDDECYSLGEDTDQTLEESHLTDFVIKRGCLLGYKNFDDSEVCIPDSVTVIGKEAFSLEKAGESLGWITLPLSDYPERKLAKITIPSTVVRIEENAFLDCKKLKTVVFEGNIDDIEIDSTAFCGTPWQNEYLTLLSRKIAQDLDNLDIGIRPSNNSNTKSLAGVMLRSLFK